VHGDNTIVLNDVLVGEVWVGSGQSNMDTDVYDYTAFDAPLKVAAAQSHPTLRLFREDVGAGWQLTTPEALRRFSAQLFYFGHSLNAEWNVPVGVMEGAVRGSPTANWISDDTVQHDAMIQKQIADWEKWHPYAPQQAKYDKDYAAWQQEVQAQKASGTPENKLPAPPWKPPRAGETRGGRGDFYDKLIRPMIPFAIRGVLWDQGEGGVNIQGVDMPAALGALMRQWRHDWGQGDFPFLYLQKPSGGGCALNADDPINLGADPLVGLPKEPQQTFWAANTRQDYQRIMTENPNAFMVTTTDLCTGVHPHNKSGYASRDCTVALATVYSRPIEYIGPTLSSCKVEGDQLRLTFTHIGKGLTFRGEQPQGYAIAGSDQKYVWATATIHGDEITLAAPGVPHPRYAEYAWAWGVGWANVFNKDGFPALMFRTQ
jgi:sialate O-acetylesterase